MAAHIYLNLRHKTLEQYCVIPKYHVYINFNLLLYLLLIPLSCLVDL